MTQQALQLKREEGEPIEFVLPFAPVSKNRWGSWPQLHQRSYRQKWRRHLDRILPTLGLDPQACLRVEIDLWFPTRARRDWQNYAFPLHWDLADALVEAGLLPDDTPTHYLTAWNGGITFRTDTNRLLTRDERTRTVIRLVPVT